MNRISFIGAGNMASAIISGLIENGVDTKTITAAEPSAQRLAEMESRYGILTSTDNSQAVKHANVVVLCVKPQILQQVCAELRSSLDHEPLLISIAAGIEMASIERWLGQGIALVRCMPNTPAQVLAGASALVANAQVNDLQKQLAYDLFAAVGTCQWFASEHDLHAVTALSGSGPAYIFLVISAMEKAAIKQGLEPESARQLAAQTVLGAAKMVLAGTLGPDQLKQNVMSPGGTTERAIDVLEAGDLPALFDQAISAAASRSLELSELLKG